LVLSGSSEADPEGGERSAEVAAMVAQHGGQIDRLVRLVAVERADGQVAQGRHDVWAFPVRTWEASSAKVTSFSIVMAGYLLDDCRGGRGVVAKPAQLLEGC
jgi:hypothetical protein